MKFTTRITSTMVAQILSAVIGLVYSIAIAKGLGPSLRGEFFVLQAYFAVAVQAATLSVHNAMTVQLSRGESEPGQVAYVALLLSVVLGIPVAALTAGVYHAMAADTGARALVLGAYFATLPLSLYKTMCGGILLGFHDIRRVNQFVVIDIVVVTVATLVAVVVLHQGLAGALMSVAITNLVLAVWGYWNLPSPKSHPRIPTDLRALVGLGWRQHTAFVISYLYLRVDAFILPLFASSAAIGQYAVARGFADRLQLAVAPLSLVMFPLISSAADADSRLYTRVTVRLMFVLGFVAALVLAVLAPFVVPLLFGAEYEGAISLVRVLAFAMAVLAIQVPINLWFVGNLKRPLLATAVASVTLASMLALGWYMASAFGTAGMAATIFLSFSISSAFGLWLARRVGIPLTPIFCGADEYRAFWKSINAVHGAPSPLLDVASPLG